MANFLTNFEKALPILLIIFITVFGLIIIFRLIFIFLINQAYKKYQNLKKLSQKHLTSKKKNFVKTEEELFRQKFDIPRAHSQIKAEARLKKKQAESGSYELLVSAEQRQEQEERNKLNIVDIVKPIGFWTAMILGQKLTYLIQSAQVINKRSQKGFWVSMIEAKDRMAGRQHGRGL